MKEIIPQEQRHATLSFMKLKSYVDSLLKNEEFQDELGYLRNKKIDKNGKRIPNDFFMWNKAKHTERRDKYYYPDFTDSERENKLIKNYGLNTYDGCFNFIFLYNSVNMMEKYAYLNHADVFDLEEFLNHGSVFIEDTEFLLDDEWIMTDLRNFSEVRPVAITINPYMSQRDIIDFVKKTYKTEIKPIQEKYKNKKITLGRNRRPSDLIKERNDFIFKNKDMNRKELWEIVNKKYPSSQTGYDYTYIDTLIREEKKKRGIK